MATAANLTLTNGNYEPFGVGVAYQVFVPFLTLQNGVKYRGEDRLGEQDNSVPAFAESMEVTHNLASPARSHDRHRVLVTFPVVRAVDGVDTVVGYNYLEMKVAFLPDSDTTERERVYRTGFDIANPANTALVQQLMYNNVVR